MTDPCALLGWSVFCAALLPWLVLLEGSTLHPEFQRGASRPRDGMQNSSCGNHGTQLLLSVPSSWHTAASRPAQLMENFTQSPLTERGAQHAIFITSSQRAAGRIHHWISARNSQWVLLHSRGQNTQDAVSGRAWCILCITARCRHRMSVSFCC